LISLLSLCLFSTCLSAQEAFLPLPVEGPIMPVQEPATTESRLFKPTKSIKPPTAAASLTAATAPKPQVNTPTVARLRRLILMPSGLTPEAMREQIVASGQSRQPVTIVGMDASAPILAKLADFFGSDVNEDTQKKVVEAVRQNLGESKTSSAPRRVEVVTWLPAEGVMAVAVYPES
jgi:hypothetical protein